MRQKDWVARWGGDEFLMVLHNSQPEDIETLVKRLSVQLKGLPLNAENQAAIDVKFSLGAALLKPDMSSEDGLHAAD